MCVCVCVCVCECVSVSVCVWFVSSAADAGYSSVGGESLQVCTNRPVYSPMWSPCLVLMYFSMQAKVLDGEAGG